MNSVIQILSLEIELSHADSCLNEFKWKTSHSMWSRLVYIILFWTSPSPKNLNSI